MQLYSLTNGYHRCLTLKGPNRQMARRLRGHDATPASPTAPAARSPRTNASTTSSSTPIRVAELLIDDIVLYDAADEKEKRPFPKRFLFTGWFDTGKQGKEWPGNFEIAPKEGYFWHAAKSVPHPDDKKNAWINLGLRGERPLRPGTHLTFRYKLEGAANTSRSSLIRRSSAAWWWCRAS